MNHHAKFRPFHLRLANAGGALARALGWRRELDAERLLELAARRTGLADFGPDDFQEPFRLLMESYNQEARLNFIGRMSARTYLLQLLENRLRMEQDRRQHPEIPAQTITAPVFILGLPRTGSTFLFELMARNTALRVPMSWEVMLPSPPPRVENFATDPRIRQAQRMFDWVDRIAPEFKYIHPVHAQLPQECLPITAQAFRSIQFHTTNHVPTYQAWFDAADLVPAYQYHRRMLQHLQAFTPRGTWLLKAPCHLFGVEALFRVYPDARMVQTHRDPTRVIGSISSHCASLRQAFSEHLDLNVIGADWCRLWALGLERTLRFRREHPEFTHRFMDLDYEAFVADPLAAARAIHQQFGLPLGDAALESMKAYLAAHPSEGRKPHQYRLEDYGLSPEHVWKEFGFIRHTAALPGLQP